MTPNPVHPIARSRCARALAALAVAVQLLLPVAAQAHIGANTRSPDAIALCTGTQTRWVRVSPEGRLVDVAPPVRSGALPDATGSACPVCAVGAGTDAPPAPTAPVSAAESDAASAASVDRPDPRTPTRWAPAEARAPPIAA